MSSRNEYYGDWDKKASALVKDSEEQDKLAKEANDKALGLTDGVSGPPVTKAKMELDAQKAATIRKKEWVDKIKCHERKMDFSGETGVRRLTVEEASGKGVEIKGASDMVVILGDELATANVAKLMIKKASNTTFQIDCKLITRFVEIDASAGVVLKISGSERFVEFIQIDGSSDVTVEYNSKAEFGSIIHNGCSALRLKFGDEEVSFEAPEARQCITKLADGVLRTEVVKRDEQEFIANYTDAMTPEDLSAAADNIKKMGNDAFQQNEFVQALAFYTQALDTGARNWPGRAVTLSNRAQTLLKMGNSEKALDDANECVSIDPSNAKGWFRKGMALHALGKYQEAIVAHLEAEKLDKKNPSIQQAIKMAQFKLRAGRS